MKSVNVDLSLVTINGEGVDLVVTIEQARELHQHLSELFRPANVWTEKQREAHRAKKPASVVWTEGEKERKERDEKWAKVGKAFRAGAHPADSDFVSRIVSRPVVHVLPNYYTTFEGGVWQEFTGSSISDSDLSKRDDKEILIDGLKVHSLIWGNPYEIGGISDRWDCRNGFEEGKPPHPADKDFVSRIVPEGSSSLKGG